MPDILIPSPSLGLNAALPVNLIDNRAAADGSQNVDFEDGVLRSTTGFNRMDCDEAIIAEPILGITQHVEENNNKNIVAVGRTKAFRHDIVNGRWNEIDGASLSGNIFNPMSFVTIPHQDAIGGKYQHLLICDGVGDIMLWAGEGESIAALAGSEGYNSGVTGHRALQVTSFQNRVILISPWENAGSGWIANPQRVRWPQIGRLQKQFDRSISGFADGGGGQVTVTCPSHGFAEGDSVTITGTTNYNGTFTVSNVTDDSFEITDTWVGNDATGTATISAWKGTGSGFYDLRDTGDMNVWAEKLASNLIIYQQHSVWQLRYVGGTTVFYPDILMTDIGLLGPRLLLSTGNTHYFVGNDFNIYAYMGGTLKKNIGGEIASFFKRDIDPKFAFRSWMAIGPQGKYLWIFIVPNGSEFVTKAYKLNLLSGAWTIRDFSHKYTKTSGITSVLLIGAGVYHLGESYEKALEGEQTYAEAVIAGTTYADVLTEIRVDERLAVGDSAGLVLEESSGLEDDGEEIDSVYISKEFDLGMPDTNKRWPGIVFDVKGESITVDYSIDENDWTNIGTYALDSTKYQIVKAFINRTGKKLQYRITSEGQTFYVRQVKIIEPEIMSEI